MILEQHNYHGWNNLGATLERTRQLAEAEQAYRRALELMPQSAETRNNLGNVLRKQGRIDEAVVEHTEALRLSPTYAPAHNNLGATLQELGDVEGAIACDRHVVELLPRSAGMYSALLYNLHYSLRYSPRQIFREHLEWARRHAEPVSPLTAAAPREPHVPSLCHPALAPFLGGEPDGISPQRLHGNDPDPRRRLRVGYVSPNFREHPVSRFFEPALANHTRDKFEVYCYSDAPLEAEDAVTERLRGLADEWRQTSGWRNARLAALVRDDRIDILVDLTGHIARNRLPMFARKPAPVQMTAIGYPDTTGMSAMDYRLTDSAHDPKGATERYHTERLVRLGRCCWCYRPDDDPPEVNELPAARTGVVTFAVTNRLVKASREVIRLWAAIMAAVPSSRLLVLGPGPRDAGGHATAAPNAATLRLLVENGVDAERAVVVTRRPRPQYLQLYNDIDVALDTFPYNGHTTTLDAMWMGVPTVSLAGQTHVQRAGLSVLSAVGLRHLVGATPDAYVEAAVALACDLPGLAKLRRDLRGMMERSHLRDERLYVRRLESAYRAMWIEWCQRGAVRTSDRGT